MTAVATTSFAIPRLTRRARSALLTAHIAVSVGWLGLDGALVALEVTGLGTGDPGARAGIAEAMAALVMWVLVPVVSASLVSGLVLALTTPWGLVRYWWVIIKCCIAGVLTATGLMLMLPRLHQIIIGEAEPVGMQLLIGRSIALALLLGATGLSVVKPWGKTPHGRSISTSRQGRGRADPVLAGASRSAPVANFRHELDATDIFGAGYVGTVEFTGHGREARINRSSGTAARRPSSSPRQEPSRR